MIFNCTFPNGDKRKGVSVNVAELDKVKDVCARLAKQLGGGVRAKDVRLMREGEDWPAEATVGDCISNDEPLDVLVVDAIISVDVRAAASSSAGKQSTAAASSGNSAAAGARTAAAATTSAPATPTFAKLKDDLKKKLALSSAYSYVNAAEAAKFKCAACHETLVEPMEADCGDTACTSCVASWRATGKTNCLICTAPNTQFKPVKQKVLRNQLNNLVVYCGYRGGGCQWTGARCELLAHATDKCTRTPCVHAKWSATTSTATPAADAGCKWRGTMKALSSHLEKDCACALVDCPERCVDSPMPRRALAAHVKACDVVLKRRKAQRVAAEKKAAVEAAAATERERVRRQAQLRAVCDKLNPAPNDVLRLNVGGTMIETTRATLCKYPLSVLGAMFAKNAARPVRADKDGVVALDCNPVSFMLLLDWLRIGTVPIDDDRRSAVPRRSASVAWPSSKRRLSVSVSSRRSALRAESITARMIQTATTTTMMVDVVTRPRLAIRARTP